LTIAGSDSGGGAGIQADLKTFCALGCFGMSAITALTAQNTMGVEAIFAVPPDFIGSQIDAVMSDIGVDAVKIGMLHSLEVVNMVVQKLGQWECPNVVLDPVMVSTSGSSLLQNEAVLALKNLLIPRADLVTPNLPEASVLLGCNINTKEQMKSAAKKLADLGCNNVLLKGGHLKQKKSFDLLYTKDTDTFTPLQGTHINTSNTHGTGCTLSSAVCAYLAKGFKLESAVKKAKAYLNNALASGAEYETGKGHGPVHHFHRLWPEPSDI
jgi:hydroxymethylpyrimidine/phosphomethylpyrimidine kinase